MKLQPRVAKPATETALHLAQIVARGALPRSTAADLDAVIARLRPLIAHGDGVLLHVAAPDNQEDIDFVATQLALLAGQTGWCRPLLLVCHGGFGGEALACPLPDLLDTAETHEQLSVAQIETGDSSFHAARLPMRLHGSTALPLLARALGSLYDLIVVACGPILARPFFAPLTHANPRVLLTIGAKVTIAQALQAGRELAIMEAEVLGVVMTRPAGRRGWARRR